MHWPARVPVSLVGPVQKPHRLVLISQGPRRRILRHGVGFQFRKGGHFQISLTTSLIELRFSIAPRTAFAIWSLLSRNDCASIVCTVTEMCGAAAVPPPPDVPPSCPPTPAFAAGPPLLASGDSAVLLYIRGAPIWSKSDALSPPPVSALSNEIGDGIAYFSRTGGADGPPLNRLISLGIRETTPPPPRYSATVDATEDPVLLPEPVVLPLLLRTFDPAGVPDSPYRLLSACPCAAVAAPAAFGVISVDSTSGLASARACSVSGVIPVDTASHAAFARSCAPAAVPSAISRAASATAGSPTALASSSATLRKSSWLLVCLPDASLKLSSSRSSVLLAMLHLRQ